jgi:hypothetical protein
MASIPRGSRRPIGLGGLDKIISPEQGGQATEIVMDHTGDSRHQFDPADARAVAEAEERFKKLTGAGFTAAKRLDANKSEPPAIGLNQVARGVNDWWLPNALTRDAAAAIRHRERGLTPRTVKVGGRDLSIFSKDTLRLRRVRRPASIRPPRSPRLSWSVFNQQIIIFER